MAMPASAATILVIVGGCGAAAVPPDDWAKSVCSALTPWRAAVASLTERAQREITETSTPAQTKQSLTTLLTGAEAASERARKRVVAAGVPDVPEGSDAAAKFVTALSRARDAYGKTKTTVTGLDAGEAKPFYDAIEAAFAKLKEEYAASALDIDTVGPARLTRAFDEVAECR